MSPGLEESGSALGETTPSPGRDIYNATSGCQVFLRFHISALISFITGILYRKCQVFMDSSLVLAPFYWNLKYISDMQSGHGRSGEASDIYNTAMTVAIILCKEACTVKHEC